MSMEVFVEAIGKIDDELVDEFYSCEPDKKVQIYAAMKMIAAAVAIVICIGTAVTWIGNDRGKKPQDEPIAAVQESEEPKESQSPQPTNETATTSPEILAQASPTPDTGVSDNKENNKGNENNQKVPDNTGQPSIPGNQTNLMAWNTVDNAVNPCGNGIADVDRAYEEYLKKLEEDKEDGWDQNACMTGIPNWKKDDPRLQGWIKEIVYYAPVDPGWYWFNTRYMWHGRVWDSSFEVQTDKNQPGAYSNSFIMKDNAKLYVLQVVTDAKSLEEANALYPEAVFSGNIQISYWNGMPMYLVSNSNGENYVRVLVDDTLITIIDKGFGMELLEEMVQNIKQVPAIDWSGSRGSSADENIPVSRDDLELPEDYVVPDFGYRIDSRIHDVKNWIPGAGTQENHVYYTDFTPLYQSLEYNKIGTGNYQSIYKNRIDLLNNLRYEDFNDDIINYVENISDSVFDNYYVLLTQGYVYAKQLDSVKVSRVGYSTSDGEIQISVEVADHSGEIIDQCNQYYTELTLISKNYLPTEQWAENVSQNHCVNGGNKVKTTVYSYTEEFLEEGTYVISTVAQWRKLRLLLREELNVDENFFNHSVLIIHVSYVDHHSRDHEKIDVTYSQKGNTMRFDIDKTIYLRRDWNLSNAYLGVSVDVLEVDRSLVDGYNVVVDSRLTESYIDYIPEQTIYVIDGKEENKYYPVAYKLTNEEERQMVLENLETTYKTECMEYTVLYDAIQNLDLENADYMVAIGANTGVNCSDLYKNNKIYARLTPDYADVYFRHGAMNYELDKQIIAVIKMEKGMLQERDVYSSLSTPF